MRSEHKPHQWKNLASSRAWIVGLTPAILAFYILGAIWAPLGWLAALFFFLLGVAWIVNPENVLYCPFCKKRVKIDARVCHHCNRYVR